MAELDPNWTVYAAPVNAVLQAAAQWGGDPVALLHGAAIDPATLQSPDTRITVDRLFTLYALAEEATGNADIGLTVGRIVYLKGLNLQLYMGSVCHRFRDYLNLMPSVLNLRGDIGEVKMRREQQYIRLEWLPLLADSGRQRYLSDEMLAASAAIVDSLCILPIPVRRAHFSYPEPSDTSALRRVFGEQLSFGQPCSCLYLDQQALNYPMIQQDYQVDQGMPSSFSRLFVGSDPEDRFLASLRQSLVRLMPEAEMNIDTVAGELNVSRRTLQRRLAARDTHFQQVLQQVRSEQACRYLGDKRLAVTEIAFLLGYADQGSFSNAFKSWYGVSPSEHRARDNA